MELQRLSLRGQELLGGDAKVRVVLQGRAQAIGEREIGGAGGAQAKAGRGSEEKDEEPVHGVRGRSGGEAWGPGPP